MCNNEAKQIKSKYLITKISITFVILLLYLFFLFNVNNIFIQIVALIALYIAERFLSQKVYNKFINSILLEEANPNKYGDVLKTFSSSSLYGSEWLNFAYFTGDYQTVIDLCYNKLANKKCKKYKYAYLMMLARTYFDNGDFENLEKICSEFELLTNASKKGKRIRNHFVIMKYYRLFLDGKFDQCKELYEEILGTKKYTNTVMAKSMATFSYAVAIYKMGDYETAKQYFTEVAKSVPMMHMAKIAENYIECINNNNEYVHTPVVLVPNPEYKPPKVNKFLYAANKIGWALLIIAICFWFVLGCINEYAAYNYEKWTHDVISPYYESFEVVDTFELYYNGEHIDSMGLIETEEDGLVLVAFYSYKDEKEIYLEVLASNIVPDRFYTASSITTDKIIGFRTFSNKEDLEKENNIFETKTFISAGEECYLGFTGIS